jgi:uncharacterized phage protein gp47/JayE
MSTFSLDELTTPLTVDQVRKSIYDVLAAIGVNTTAWKPGAVVRTMIAAAAIILASLSALTALIARGGFLDLAEGAWLRLKAFYDYGVEWNGPSFATGDITLNNTAGGVYTYDPDDLILVNTATGKSYRNVNPVSIGALQTGITVTIRAVESGSASTALPGEIAFGSPVLGVNIVQTATITGADGEDDPSLRARSRERTGALSPNGPQDAYAYVAKSAKRADGTPIGVTRVNAKRDGVGGIDVYVASDIGAIPGTVGNLATDLGVVDEEMQRKSTPLTVTLRTHAATAVPVDVLGGVWIFASAGYTVDQVRAAVQGELIEFFRTAPIGGFSGGYIYRDAILAVIGRARVNALDPKSPRLGIFRVEIPVPAANIPLSPDEFPVLGSYNLGVNLVANT